MDNQFIECNMYIKKDRGYVPFESSGFPSIAEEESNNIYCYTDGKLNKVEKGNKIFGRYGKG